MGVKLGFQMEMEEKKADHLFHFFQVRVRKNTIMVVRRRRVMMISNGDGGDNDCCDDGRERKRRYVVVVASSFMVAGDFMNGVNNKQNLTRPIITFDAL
ncbi:unnamed protein product [Lactuca virosa]|uniref:Transmembrane protein n=1 Tax=Lactuca virosa TaxID=75947 RepID=A0AAU9LH34_9ASTR|nr:unnamed protein product [Lactuca virosa]